MSSADRDLERLGDLLEARISHQLAAPPRRRRRRLAAGRGRRRRLVAGGGAAALALGGTAAYASTQLPGTDEVERGLPGGSVIFAGTDPSCTTSDGIVFERVLQNPPADDTLASGGTWSMTDGSHRDDDGLLHREACLERDGVVTGCILLPADDELPDHDAAAGRERSDTLTDEHGALLPLDPELEAERRERSDRFAEEHGFPLLPSDPVVDHEGSAQVFADDDNRVADGCRGLDSEGLHWECYAGERAVEEEIIGPGFLGEELQGPGRG